MQYKRKLRIKMRIAVIDRDTCKPNDCATGPMKPCIKYCPRNRTGDQTIVLGSDGFPHLNPLLCSGCGICVKKCPFHCYKIINLPEMLDSDLTHKYAPDGFSLFRMLIPNKGRILGVIGQNGIGKTTALNILSGNIKMNLGRFGESAPDWPEIINQFKGSILQEYFTQLSQKKIKIVLKPQEITAIPKHVQGTVQDLLIKIAVPERFHHIITSLSLEGILDRDISVLSGGELQRVAIAAALLRDGNCHLIDEPTSYLDISQRLNMARLIRSLANNDIRIIVIEHDLAILDYLSDQVCLLYGEPGAFGIISNVQGVRVGINTYLNGYIRDENMKFREEPIRFHEKPPDFSMYERSKSLFSYDKIEKTLGSFKLTVASGEIHIGEVIGLLGPNGIGKTTFINLIAKKIKPDFGSLEGNALKIALKPQYIEYDPKLHVMQIIQKIRTSEVFDAQYKKRILNGFRLEDIENRTIEELSGGELQRLAIADCLTTDADLYLIDEPSAFLDVEMRLLMALILRRSIESIKKAAFVVEHDIITQDFICDSLIVFNGKPGFVGFCTPPQDLRSGMNEFLKMMDITFRRDLTTGRPRVNKYNSSLDKYQRKIGEYYYIPTKEEDISGE